MDKEQQHYQQSIRRCEDLLRMMNSAGQGEFQRTLQLAYEQQNSLEIISNNDELNMARGRLITLRQMMNMKEEVQDELESLRHPDDGQSELEL